MAPHASWPPDVRDLQRTVTAQIKFYFLIENRFPFAGWVPSDTYAFNRYATLEIPGSIEGILTSLTFKVGSLSTEDRLPTWCIFLENGGAHTHPLGQGFANGLTHNRLNVLFVTLAHIGLFHTNLLRSCFPCMIKNMQEWRSSSDLGAGYFWGKY